MKEILLAAFGATGFAVLFGMQKKRLWIIFLTSGAAWYGDRLLCELLQNTISALFLITIFDKFFYLVHLLSLILVFVLNYH